MTLVQPGRMSPAGRHVTDTQARGMLFAAVLAVHGARRCIAHSILHALHRQQLVGHSVNVQGCAHALWHWRAYTSVGVQGQAWLGLSALIHDSTGNRTEVDMEQRQTREESPPCQNAPATSTGPFCHLTKVGLPT
jgi:hypothetical protein